MVACECATSRGGGTDHVGVVVVMAAAVAKDAKHWHGSTQQTSRMKQCVNEAYIVYNEQFGWLCVQCEAVIATRWEGADEGVR